MHAFDYSEVAKTKALQLAKEAGVTIDYAVTFFQDFKAAGQFDAVALIYPHTDAKTRAPFFPGAYQFNKNSWMYLQKAIAKHFGTQKMKIICMIFQ